MTARKTARLSSLASLSDCGIPARTLREWCEQGRVVAEKRGDEWYVDLADMLRRHELDELAEAYEEGDEAALAAAEKQFKKEARDKETRDEQARLGIRTN